MVLIAIFSHLSLSVIFHWLSETKLVESVFLKYRVGYLDGQLFFPFHFCNVPVFKCLLSFSLVNFFSYFRKPCKTLLVYF